MKMRRFSSTAALLSALIALFAGGRAGHAQSPSAIPFEGVPIRIEVRLADRASGQDAAWGATGQILIPLDPADPALQRWRPGRAVAVAPARQTLGLAPAGRGLIRVGREIPFAGWFLRHGVACGWLDAKSEWREVASALEVESCPPAADGALCLRFTPEFTYLDGRTRRAVVFPGERVEIFLDPGTEARFVPDVALQAFYGRLLAGYDPLRRVWPVELLLRADRVELFEP